MPELHLVGWSAADREETLLIPITCFPFALGRSSTCDHRLDDVVISRRHCAFSLRDGRVWVEDLGSLNGTLINGEPVVEPRPLGQGDALQLAHFTFLVHLHDGPSESQIAEWTNA
jgi:pSer/pThr/pTyr-binding forkhead associated (FHA) protein